MVYDGGRDRGEVLHDKWKVEEDNAYASFSDVHEWFKGICTFFSYTLFHETLDNVAREESVSCGSINGNSCFNGLEKRREEKRKEEKREWERRGHAVAP